MNQLTTTAVDLRANLELARAFAESKMVPDHFKKSIGDCYIAINMAHRFKFDPYILMQEMYIIQGKPMMSGKLSAAILNNSLAEPLRPEYSGEGDERTIVLTGRPEGEEKPLSVTAKVKDAKTANEQWKKNPDQMLMYFAARVWGRRYAPDVLLGIIFDDEEMSPSLVPAQPRTQIASPPMRDTKVKPDIIDELTGEVLEGPAALPMKPDEKPYDWGVRFVAAFRTALDIDAVDGWLAANAETLASFEKTAPKVHGNLTKAVSEFKLELLNQVEGT